MQSHALTYWSKRHIYFTPLLEKHPQTEWNQCFINIRIQEFLTLSVPHKLNAGNTKWVKFSFIKNTKEFYCSVKSNCESTVLLHFFFCFLFCSFRTCNPLDINWRRTVEAHTVTPVVFLVSVANSDDARFLNHQCNSILLSGVIFFCFQQSQFYFLKTREIVDELH